MAVSQSDIGVQEDETFSCLMSTSMPGVLDCPLETQNIGAGSLGYPCTAHSTSINPGFPLSPMSSCQHNQIQSNSELSQQEHLQHPQHDLSPIQDQQQLHPSVFSTITRPDSSHNFPDSQLNCQHHQNHQFSQHPLPLSCLADNSIQTEPHILSAPSAVTAARCGLKAAQQSVGVATTNFVQDVETSTSLPLGLPPLWGPLRSGPLEAPSLLNVTEGTRVLFTQKSIECAHLQSRHSEDSLAGLVC
ncbi:unnamed protein product [Protopolystoma xenopodis]|uniref:Uncharacterized protein n=1 Tax=Protopolystoma xenopodis TaxID=117903 RepID=A0A448WRX2_9PLAT|nr:unnamed protein product [Protopolystoma xenopodis]